LKYFGLEYIYNGTGFGSEIVMGKFFPIEHATG
jgi:hypothetical protein